MSSTVTMVRTVCCETYKCTGMRCANCPNRPENHEAAQRFQTQAPVSMGRRFTIRPATPQPTVTA